MPTSTSSIASSADPMHQARTAVRAYTWKANGPSFNAIACGAAVCRPRFGFDRS